MENKCHYCYFLKGNRFEVPGDDDQKCIDKWITEANVLESYERFSPLKTIKFKNEDLATTELKSSNIEEKQAANPIKSGPMVMIVAHGTKIQFVLPIIQQGFTPSKGIQGERKHGDGVYFTDLYYKTTLYSSMPGHVVCNDCRKTKKCCAFLCEIPASCLKEGEGIKSKHQITFIRALGFSKAGLKMDSFGRLWREQIPLNEGEDRAVLLEDKHFNEYVVAGEQLKPKYLVIVTDNEKS